MSKFTRHAIYSYVSEAVDKTDRHVYCTSRFEPIPPKYPACYITVFDRMQNRGNVTLDHSDEQHRWSAELQVYSNLENGANDEADEILHDAEMAFKRLGFILDSVTPINTDPTVVRLAARLHRVIGGNDEMPEEQHNEENL